jgi:hypothetical protein
MQRALFRLHFLQYESPTHHQTRNDRQLAGSAGTLGIRKISLQKARQHLVLVDLRVSLVVENQMMEVQKELIAMHPDLLFHCLLDLLDAKAKKVFTNYYLLVPDTKWVQFAMYATLQLFELEKKRNRIRRHYQKRLVFHRLIDPTLSS